MTSDDEAPGPGTPGSGGPASDAAGGGDDRPSGAELARQALEQAKADARSRGAAPGQHSGQSKKRSREQAGRRKRTSSGRDPLTLSSAIEELVTDRGWELPTAVASVFARWPDIVGAELAAHTRPESLSEGVLVVRADSAAWATQVRLLSTSLLSRLREELGETAVERVQVRGPAGSGRSGRGRGSMFGYGV